MRGTTRDPARRGAIEAAGAEPFVGDPDLVATLAPALEHVGVACLLLGSATGAPEHLAALHIDTQPPGGAPPHQLTSPTRTAH